MRPCLAVNYLSDLGQVKQSTHSVSFMPTPAGTGDQAMTVPAPPVENYSDVPSLSSTQNALSQQLPAYCGWAVYLGGHAPPISAEKIAAPTAIILSVESHSCLGDNVLLENTCFPDSLASRGGHRTLQLSHQQKSARRGFQQFNCFPDEKKKR